MTHRNTPLPTPRPRAPHAPDPLMQTLGAGQRCPAIDCTRPVLGIDGSVGKFGFCLAHRSRVSAWVWNPKGTGVKRLAAIRAEISRVITLYGVSAVTIEGYSMASKNTRAHSTGEAGGVARLALHDAGVPVLEVPPNSLKMFLSGKGNTPKTGMPLALFKRYSVEYANEDEADAAGLAILCAAWQHYHTETLAKFQLEALAKLDIKMM